MDNQSKKTKRIYLKVKEKFSAIESDQDLNKHKLTHMEYYSLAEVLNKVFQNPETGVYCMHGSVAEWCRKAGLKVVDPHDGDYHTCVNYTISVL